MMTIGANALPILDVPRGWIRKRQIKMAQVVPTMVDEEISDLTISRLRAISVVTNSEPRGSCIGSYPWMAPRTDCAGVSTPSKIPSVSSDQPRSFQRTGHNQRHPKYTNDLQERLREGTPLHKVPRRLAARTQFIGHDPFHPDTPLLSRIASHDICLWRYLKVSIAPRYPQYHWPITCI